jgi:branched-chain amino acid transport system permease protein
MSITSNLGVILFLRKNWTFLGLILAVMLFPLFVRTYFVTRVGIIVLIYVINVAGMSLVARYAGIISLGHAAFFAFGAYISAMLTVYFRVNPWLAMAISATATVVFAYLFTVPFLKLRRVYLAMATLGLGEVIFLLAKNMTNITGGVTGIPGIPYLSIGNVSISEDWQVFYLVGAFAVLSIFLSENISRTRLGRAYHAIRTNETAAQAMGINVQWELVRVFCYSALLSSLSGSLLAHFINFISPELFTLHFSFSLLIFVIIGGANIWGGLLTAVALTSLSELLRGLQDFSIGFYGALLVLTLFIFPEGLAVLFPNPHSKRNSQPVPLSPGLGPVRKEEKRKRGSDKAKPTSVMEFSDISKSFGGTKALVGVSGSIKNAQILGIIGPNGAGKTTLLNVLNGFLLPNQGKIVFEGQDVTGKSPYMIARLGLGRTFQISNLFRGMTVIENVMVGGHIKGTSGLFTSGLNSGKARRQEAAIMEKALDSLEFLGLLHQAHELVENVPFGEQKLVEVARALTIEPKIMLLDEPASGLNTGETKTLAGLIGKIRDKDISIVLVEHNMPLIMGISDQVLVLDFGNMIALGTPQEISGNEKVIRAYLGKGTQHA